MTATLMISCREFVEFLDDYLEGRLSEAQRTSFEAHTNVCPPCLEYLRTYRDAAPLARAALRDLADVPEEIPDDLVAAILAAKDRG